MKHKFIYKMTSYNEALNKERLFAFEKKILLKGWCTNDARNNMSIQEIYLDRTEKDNSLWLSLIEIAIKTAKRFEIHCWNEETDWIEFALQHGTLKESDWKYGKIIEGDVRPEFITMILEMPKPTDIEIYNKMTPFFNIFLDDTKFQSCHYGTEIYIEEE